MKTLTLPEVPPALSAEQMDLMTDAELKAEDDRRYTIYKDVEAVKDRFFQAWLSVYNHQKNRAAKAAIRAEVLAELKAGWKGDEKLPEVNTNTTTV